MQKVNIGLKLWSSNTDYYFQIAQELYKENIFDFIELYIEPSTTQYISKWATLDIPFTLHAPHFMNGVNLADKEKFEYNKIIFAEVEKFNSALNAQYVVIHPGMNNIVEETVRQLNIIKPHNAVIENKPFKAPLKPEYLCRGATYEEMDFILRECDCDFCLDIGHAICAANSLHVDPYEYINQMQRLNPNCYHLSGNYITSDIDRHLHFNDGNYDYKKIFLSIDTNKNITIETKKNSKTSLDDFVLDSLFIKNILKEIM